LITSLYIFFTLSFLFPVVLDSVSSSLKQGDAYYNQSRDLLLSLFEKVGWVYEETKDEIASGKGHKSGNIKKMTEAKLLLATNPDKVKKMYSDVIKEDPQLSNLYKDIKAKFKDITATVAVAPFVNITGNKNDKWMVYAISEALTNDLPKMNFTVLERAQLGTLYAEKAGDVISTEQTTEIGKSVGADFMLLGSFFHEAPNIKISVRFVEIKTGIVFFSTTVANYKNNLMTLLAELSNAISTELNNELSEQTMRQLTGNKISSEELETIARRDQAKESLRKNIFNSDTRPEKRSRWPFWTAVTLTGIGTGVAVLGFMKSSDYSNDSNYYDGLYHVSKDVEKRSLYKSERDSLSNDSNKYEMIGATGASVALLSIGYLIFDELTDKRDSQNRIEPGITLYDKEIILSVKTNF